ncbi:SAM-dependent methyltransferase [soil metagenome]
MRLPDSYFEEMYDADADPWGFQSRWYEQRKYALTLAALPRRRYESAFEPGCSLGVLTAALAARCDRLVATDVSASARGASAERLAGTGNVELRRWALGDPWPPERFDLIVLSEVGYYLHAPALRSAVDAATEALAPGGNMLAVHWRHPVSDYPLSGDEVHELVRGTPGLARTAAYVDTDLRLETYARVPPPARSVAETEGLL